uniref:AP-3 complex subunit beta n=1 Tax=Hyaloperonospora arabidopsidis (strain Emoy2) TaxID=559515 RepID=M4BK39_HYAAE
MERMKSSITGDAHFFEESMNLDRIRKLLDNKLGVAGHAEKLEAMKALLASISKGEDVSSLFADVVKNVIVASVEVKKLVYMYLVHYADATHQCRELALLSINSFQKDLADPNQLIRALALRVMTSIRVREILQIQLIAIRKCAADDSPYVRKCATNAISKVFVVDPEQKDVLAEIIGTLLHDSSTMVLGSAIQALSEVCPDRLDLLHGPFRKLCHLLADIDEWGQTVTLDVLTWYCRDQFQVVEELQQSRQNEAEKEKATKSRKKSGFYSDENGDSDDSEDANEKLKLRRGADRSFVNKSPFMLGREGSREEPVASVGSVFRRDTFVSGLGAGEKLDEDHRLLLRSSIPLLKSRNSAVVLAVATLHYYCGTHSMASSTLIGKSLVRIMRNQREIQYVVLSVISSMATTHPDMFRPFLQEFFVRATDPAYARKLKLDILTALVTNDNVNIILREFQAYVRHVDKSFVTMTVRALGRVADAMPSVAERCLSGLMRLVRSSNEQVVAESVVVIRQLLQQQTIKKDRHRVVRSLAAMMVTGRVTSPSARASIVWMLGEFNDDGVGTICAEESLRLLVKNFSDEATEVRLQLLNLAVKLGLHEPQNRTVQLLLQYVIELCQFDIDYDVRDRARLVRAALSGDASIVDPHKLFASKKPAPLIGYDDDSKSRFTLGTLSSVVRHSVPGYHPLPNWRLSKPDPSLRDESSLVDSNRGGSSHLGSKEERRSGGKQGFYTDESASSYESDSASSHDSGLGSGSDDDYENSSSEESRFSSESASSSSQSESESEESFPDTKDHPRRRQKGGKTKLPQKRQQPKKTGSFNAFSPVDLLGSPPGGFPINLLSQIDGPVAAVAGPTSNLLGDLMNLSVSSSMTPPLRYELLSSLVGNGLDVHYAFLRQPSTHSPSMNVIQMWLANNSSEPISRIQVVGKNPQRVFPFPTLPVLFPGGSNSMVQLHVDFMGSLDTVALEIETSAHSYDVDLPPVIGELFIPQQMSLDDFERRIAITDTTSLHTSEFALPVPVQLTAIVQAVLRDYNVAQIYEIDSVDGVVGKCKFAGRFRSGAASAEHVLIALEVQLQEGKGRLLVVMRDSVLSQRLSTCIRRTLSLQDA